MHAEFKVCSGVLVSSCFKQGIIPITAKGNIRICSQALAARVVAVGEKTVVVELKNASKAYPAGSEQLAVLHDVSLSIAKGDFVAIMGPSGSGKSTLLHLIGCLDKPTSGQVVIDGVDAARLPSDELAELRGKKIGFVFQAFNLLANLSAEKNVELAMSITEAARKERRERAVELLKQVGLAHRMQHKPAEMSGGEKQRVAIARALSNKPEILLMDEPTGNLDTKSSEEVMALVDRLSEQGITIILITHEQDIAGHAEKIVRLRDGRIESITNTNTAKKRGGLNEKS